MNSVLEKKTFSPKTTIVYLSIIKRLTKLGFKYPNKKNEKVEYIKEFFAEHKLDKASTRLDLLNLIIVLRAIEELPTDKLKDYRGQLSKERVTKNVGKMNEIKDTLMDIGKYREALMKAFEDGEYKKFIVNYLMLTYGVRNMDVDVEIIKDPKEMTDDKQNYLILKGKKATWVRNSYKTKKTFGVQTHVITDPEFIKAVKGHGVGRIFAEGQLNNQLKKLLIEKMNEAKVFKMVVDEAYDAKDTKRINELSKSRGTSISTIKAFYNVNAEDEIIRDM
tara:strand:- start:2017 stop:2847 length:831 start_codon:yes stop_codon:yes gene_type:complete